MVYKESILNLFGRSCCPHATAGEQDEPDKQRDGEGERDKEREEERDWRTLGELFLQIKFKCIL